MGTGLLHCVNETANQLALEWHKAGSEKSSEVFSDNR